MLYTVLFIVAILLLVAVTSNKKRVPTDTRSDEEKSAATAPFRGQVRLVRYLKVNIAGTSHRQGLYKYTGKYQGTIIPEPSNEHDHNALMILAPDGHHLGYVPADDTQIVRDTVHNTFPAPCQIELHRKRDQYDGHYYYWGEAFIEQEPSNN